METDLLQGGGLGLCGMHEKKAPFRKAGRSGRFAATSGNLVYRGLLMCRDSILSLEFGGRTGVEAPEHRGKIAAVAEAQFHGGVGDRSRF